LTLNYDEALSTFAFKFNLSRYNSHVHVTASSANLRMPASMPPSLVYARSAGASAGPNP
jgi:hypothetical protein